MAVSNEVKRIVVLVLSGALLFISVASIVNSYQDIVSLIINVLVIVGSVGGLVGAWRMDVRHLGWFFWSAQAAHHHNSPYPAQRHCSPMLTATFARCAVSDRLGRSPC